MQNNNLQVSYFNSVTDKSPKKMTFGEVINSIRGVEVKVEVQSIRDLYKDGRQKEGDKMKKKLPAFTARPECLIKVTRLMIWRSTQVV